MITQEVATVTISNNARYYQHLFSFKLKQGMKIIVPVSELPDKTCRLIEAKCDECDEVFVRQYKQLTRVDKHLCYTCTRLEVGNKNKGNTWGFASRDIRGENHPRWNPNKDKFSLYRSKVYEVTRRQDITVLEHYDKPRGLCGEEGVYQLDHIVSIKEGFDNNIDPEIIGSIENLQFLPWKTNRTKGYKQCIQ